MDKELKASEVFVSLEHRDLIRRFNCELLIVFAKRIVELGGKLNFHVKEIDDTKGDALAFKVDETGMFHFELRKIQ